MTLNDLALIPAWWCLLYSTVVIADWLVVASHNQRLKYFTKPAVMLVLFLLPVLVAQGDTQSVLMVAVILSLLGDVFLLLSGRFFIAGLISFLLAHLGYIACFFPWLSTGNGYQYPAFLVILVFGFFFFQRILLGLRKTSGGRRLRIAVIFYCLVITTMLMSAVSAAYNPDVTSPVACAFFLCGAILFFTSDSLLAFDRFVHPYLHARIIVRITYHAGQFLLVTGLTLASVLA